MAENAVQMHAPECACFLTTGFFVKTRGARCPNLIAGCCRFVDIALIDTGEVIWPILDLPQGSWESNFQAHRVLPTPLLMSPRCRWGIGTMTV